MHIKTPPPLVRTTLRLGILYKNGIKVILRGHPQTRQNFDDFCPRPPSLTKLQNKLM